jgi:DNA helicase HerA-like ATPase
MGNAIGKVLSTDNTSLIVRFDAPDVLPDIGGLLRVEVKGGSIFATVSNYEGESAARLLPMGESLGENGKFMPGVSNHPKPGAPVFAATIEDTQRVYGQERPGSLRIGQVFGAPDVSVFTATDNLLAKHFAVLGTTGSGKSCTVALLLHRLLESNPAGHILLLDLHNEYAASFKERAEIIDTTSLQLPYWLLNFEESAEVFATGEGAERQSQMSILRDCIPAARKAFAKDNPDAQGYTVDTPVPYRMSELSRLIREGAGKLDKPESAAPYLRLLARLESLSSDRRYAFMFSGILVRDNLADLMGRLLRIPAGGKPLSIIDLSGVPSEIVDVLVSVLARTVFDFGLWSAEAHKAPVLLVCEEAHRYVPANPSDGFAPTRRALGRIAKEGRKYGISLGLVTQRPSELSASILSQCGTLFVLRMSNEQDQQFVSRAMPDGVKNLLSALPVLRPQEAVVVGEGVSVPMRLKFDDLTPDQLPHSASARFSQAWSAESADRAFLERTIERWRKQERG